MGTAVTPSFEEWEANVGDLGAEVAGPVGRMTTYRMALFAIEVGWTDVALLEKRVAMQPVAAQLYRALGSIAANIAEGYSRSSGRARVRLFEYALGSARECQVWYRAARPALPPELFEQRVDTLAQISKLLSTIIPAERRRRIRKYYGLRTAD